MLLFNLESGICIVLILVKNCMCYCYRFVFNTFGNCYWQIMIFYKKMKPKLFILILLVYVMNAFQLSRLWPDGKG